MKLIWALLLALSLPSSFLSAQQVARMDAPCGPDDFRTLKKDLYGTLPDGTKQFIGTTCAASAADIPKILDILEQRPSGHDSSYFLQASGALADLVEKVPETRTAQTKKRLIALARKPDYSIHDGAFDSLMHFKGDSEVRALITDTLHNNPNESTRGKSTARLVINASRDPSVIPELRKALDDPSDFVRARAAQDLARLGDYSGLDVMKKILAATPTDRSSDNKLSHAVRAAGEIRHPDLLAPLKKIAALKKEAPRSASEARTSIWLIELKQLKDSAARKSYLQSITETELGVAWMHRTMIYQMENLGIRTDEVVAVLEPVTKNSDWHISNEAKEAIKSFERIGKKQ